MEGAVEDLPRCSAPRLLEETLRLLRGGAAAPAVRLLDALDALATLLPPVAQYVRSCTAEERSRYWQLLEAVDAQVGSGKAFDDAMLLASLLVPMAFEPSSATTTTEGDEGGGAGEGDSAESTGDGAPSSQLSTPAVEGLLRDLVQSARLPRKMAERCRMILMAQPTLAGRRRRRGGLAGFRSYPLFDEALSVFEAWATVSEEHREAAGHWRAGGSPTLAPDAQGSRRRRRRRGRRPADAPAASPPSNEG
jgi:poly(A) polymerase